MTGPEGPAHLEELAAWVAGFRLDAETAERLGLRLFTTAMDWGGALIAGVGHPLHRRYAAGLDDGGSGPCAVLGSARRRPPVAAAAANAAISHLWEVDDAHRLGMLHPGVAVVPGVIALAEAHPEIPAARVAGAVIVGYEAAIRLGMALGKAHYRVCHSTATAGSFGAAAAASCMLGLDAAATLSAFGHAGTQAAGLWQFLDDGATDSKAFHAAIAVRNGLTAALLARVGLDGARRILEGERGMLAAWGLPPADPAALRPGGPLLIESVTVKAWPTCGHMHTALDCADAVAPRVDGEIAGVVVEVPEVCLQIAGVTDPATVGEAKFSTSFCIAAALSGRRPDIRGLTPGLVQDPSVRALARRIRVVADAGFSARFPQERPARVTVTLADGRVESVALDLPRTGLSRPQVIERARDVLSLGAAEIDAERLARWCDGLVRQDPHWRAAALFDLAAA